MSRIGLLLLSLLVAALPLAAMAGDHLPGRVVRVSDGDSLVLAVRGAEYRVELHGIDAPESNQPWGNAATGRLRRRLDGAFVVVDVEHVDAARRVHGRIRLRDRDIAEGLLYDGLAWSTVAAQPSAPGDTGPGHRQHPYTLAQRAARCARRGLWSDPDPVPPWLWRGGNQVR